MLRSRHAPAAKLPQLSEYKTAEEVNSNRGGPKKVAEIAGEPAAR